MIQFPLKRSGRNGKSFWYRENSKFFDSISSFTSGSLVVGQGNDGTNIFLTTFGQSSLELVLQEEMEENGLGRETSVEII